MTALTINRLTRRDVEALIDRVAGDRDAASQHSPGHRRARRRHPAVRRGDDEGGARSRGRRRGGADDRGGPLADARRSRQPARLADGAARPAGRGQGGRADRRGDRAGVFSCAACRPWRACPKPSWRLRSNASSSPGCLSRQGTPPHATYLFKHALVQDAAYGTLLREPRRGIARRHSRSSRKAIPRHRGDAARAVGAYI